MLKIISIDELAPGMMITQVIEQNGPVKIRKVGLVRSKDMITGLAEMGVVRVEVDLEQSVELEPADVPTSMTQKLLQGEYDHASQVDKSLSDQFNRSLFLPSVSELPSMWQIYVKQAGMALSVIVIGIGLGFAGAWLPQWLNSNDEQLSTSTTSLPEPVESAATVSTSEAVAADVQSDNVPELDSIQPEQIEGQATAVMPNAQVDDGTSAAEPSLAVVADDIEEGEFLTQTSDEISLESVSPELLERFNRALDDLENDTGPQERETTVSVVDDLPRVDQLPALTLTRLPSMTFSAHMYSSNRDTRWVRVNGNQLFEGDWIERELQLVNIEPQRVVLSFQGELFTMAALTDW